MSLSLFRHASTRLRSPPLVACSSSIMGQDAPWPSSKLNFSMSRHGSFAVALKPHRVQQGFSRGSTSICQQRNFAVPYMPPHGHVPEDHHHHHHHHHHNNNRHHQPQKSHQHNEAHGAEDLHHMSPQELHARWPDKYDSHGHEYTERPDPWGTPKGKRHPKNQKFTEFVIFFLGGYLVFAILCHYRPDDSIETWARKEALKRMKSRGIDVEGISETSRERFGIIHGD